MFASSRLVFTEIGRKLSETKRGEKVTKLRDNASDKIKQDRSGTCKLNVALNDGFNIHRLATVTVILNVFRLIPYQNH